MTDFVNISRSQSAAGDLHGHDGARPHDVWVVNAEATAALLIALGSLLTFAAALDVIPDSGIARWAQDCLFPLQFPVLYFCGGYLYERYRSVRTRRAWAANLRREATVLLVPFATFTVLALLVGAATGSATSLTPLALVKALLVQPIAPLGYFYTLLLLYAITPTPASRRNVYGLLIAALGCKLAIVALHSMPATAPLAAALPYALVSVAENWIWFAGGIALSLLRALPLLRSPEKAWALGALWCAASIITFTAGWIGEASHALLDAIGVMWFASLFSSLFRAGAQNGFYGFVSRYTMAFWLMAPLFLRLLFSGLSAAGATASAPWLCFAAGLLACFGAPIALMALLARIGKLGFIVYPARYLPPPPAEILRRRAAS